MRSLRPCAAAAAAARWRAAPSPPPLPPACRCRPQARRRLVLVGGGGERRGASSSPSSSSPAALASPPATSSSSSSDDESQQPLGVSSQQPFGVSARQLAILMQAALEHQSQQQQPQAPLPPPSPLLLPPPPSAATLPALAAALRTSLLSGPPGDDADLADRRAAFGANVVPPPPLTPYWRLLLDALSDPTLLLLSAAGAVSLALAFANGGGGGDGGAHDSAASLSTAAATVTATLAATTAAATATPPPPSTEWIDGAAILCSVAVCSAVAAGTNYDKQSKFRALSAARDAGILSRVVRGGRERAAAGGELVVGDVLLLEAGDILPADALLLPPANGVGAADAGAGAASPSSSSAAPSAALLRVDESHLTGESDEVAKAPLPALSLLNGNGGGDGAAAALTPAAVARAALYSGSKVLEGYGRALVVAVGPSSQQGLIAALVAASTGDGAAEAAAAAAGPAAPALAPASSSSSDPDLLLRERTRLAAQLEDVAGAVGRAGAAAAGAVLGANVLLFAVSSALPAATAALAASASSSDDPPTSAAFLLAWLAALSSPQALREYLRFFTASVAVLVVAVPEGLPLAVTLALAFGVSKMLEERNLVRRLDACEAMALCTSVCSDKTGTLTENDMRVVRVVAGGRAFAVRPSARRRRGGGGGGGGEAAAEAGTATGEEEEEEEAEEQEDPTGVLAEVRPPRQPTRRALSRDKLEDADVVTMVSLSLDSRDEQQQQEEGEAGGEGGAARRAAAAAAASDERGEPSQPPSSSDGASPFPFALSTAVVLRDLSVACIALTSTASVRRKAPPPSGAGAAEAAAAAAQDEPGRSSRGGSSLQLDRAGNRTECALLEFAGRLGGRLVDAGATGNGGSAAAAAATTATTAAGVGPGAEAALDGRRLEVARRLVFSSERKRSSAVLESAAPFPPEQQQQPPPPSVAALPEASWPVATASVPPGAARVYVKGAADVVLARCTHVLLAASERAPGGGTDGGDASAPAAGCVAVPLTARDRSALLRLALGDAYDGAGGGAQGGEEEGGGGGGALRLLALAYRDAAPASSRADADADADAESGLTLIALAGLEDPIRAEAAGAVRDCARAGIRVRMLTGDSPATAAAIAQQCGILPAGRERRRALLAARERRRAAVAEARARGDARSALPPAWDEEEEIGASAAAAAAEEGQQEAEAADGWALMDGAELRALILRSREGDGDGSSGDGSSDGNNGKGASPSSSAPNPDVDLDALARLWPRLRVVARCTPADKHALVSGYRALRRRGAAAAAQAARKGPGGGDGGLASLPSPRAPLLLLPPGDDGAIAVTGDGTNDAPALAAADVGFSMASGTAVAKEAADILLLDDNFASVVTSVRWGRNVHRSVARFLTFQLSASVVAVSAAAAGALLLRGETVLAPVQLLWVNLIVDSLASLALATEPPPPGVLDEPPRRAGASVVSPRMAGVIGAQAAFQLAALAWLLLPGGGGAALGFVVVDCGGAADEAALRAEQLTLVFNSFVAMSLGSQVAVRAIGRGAGRPNGGGGGQGGGERPAPDASPPPLLPALLRPLEGLDRAPLFVGILALEAVLQACIVQFGGRAFSTVPLSVGEWSLSAALGLGALLVGAAAAAAPGVPDEWPDEAAGASSSLRLSATRRRLLKDSDAE